MIRVEGLDEVLAFLSGLATKVSGDASWQGPWGRLGKALIRYATSISPVVTGSYAGSHRATVSGKGVTLSIDPTARNTASGVLVTQYAGAVEERHQVYAKTEKQINRLAVGALEDLVKGMGL